MCTAAGKRALKAPWAGHLGKDQCSDLRHSRGGHTFSAWRNFEMRVRKIEQDRRSACGLADAQFFSRLRHR